MGQGVGGEMAGELTTGGTGMRGRREGGTRWGTRGACCQGRGDDNGVAMATTTCRVVGGGVTGWGVTRRQSEGDSAWAPWPLVASQLLPAYHTCYTHVFDLMLIGALASY